MRNTLKHVHYEIHDEVSNNDKEHNSFIKTVLFPETINIFQIGFLLERKQHFFL